MSSLIYIAHMIISLQVHADPLSVALRLVLVIMEHSPSPEEEKAQEQGTVFSK